MNHSHSFICKWKDNMLIYITYRRKYNHKFKTLLPKFSGVYCICKMYGSIVLILA